MSFFALAAAAKGFDFPDVHISGIMSDGATGTPIAYAGITVTRSNCSDGAARILSDAEGRYELDVQVDEGTKCSMSISFTCEGYISRTFVIDASKLVEKDNEEQTWFIQLQVQLWRNGIKGAKASPLGKCVFSTDIETFECKGEASVSTGMDAEYLRLKTEVTEPVADLVIYGRVESLFGDAAINGAEIIVRSPSGEQLSVTKTDRKGSYFFRLAYDQIVHVTYQMQGFVSKKIIFDTNSVPVQERDPGFAANVDVKLFEPIPEEDLSFLSEPMGRSAFDPATLNFKWDLQVTMPVKERLDAIIHRHIQRQRAGS
jgi:hypothetical protein